MDKQKYFLIGEVSSQCNIPIKTLRYYDEIGLLKPEKIDKSNNYRYYSKQQILLIIIIKDLKESGFSLGEIRRLLERNDLEELRTCMENKLNMVSGKIEELECLRKRMRIYIEGIKTGRKIGECVSQSEDGTVSIRIEVKQIPLIPVVFTRYRCPSNPSAFIERYSQLQSLIERYRLTRVGPRMAVFHDNYINFDYSNADIEVCAQVADMDDKSPLIREYGGFYAAVAMHKGGYENTAETYGQMLRWLDAKGYDYVGPATEKYIIDAGSTKYEENYVTELILPIIMRS